MISIIVPIFNAGKWLTRCIESILCQTYTDFELLLINDGSYDNSVAICNEFANKDTRIRVFHKTNAGVSSARQLGINHVRGEYVIHVDADDYIKNDMLEKMYSYATTHQSDMVICDYFEIVKNKTRYIEQKPSNTNPDDIIIDLLKGNLMGALWNKLVSTSCYIGVSFPQEITYEEDLLACILMMQNVKKVSYLNNAFYYYVRGENTMSLSHKYNRNTYLSEQLVLNSIENLVVQKYSLRQAFYYRSLLSAYLAFTNQVLSRKEYITKYQNMISIFKKVNIPIKIKAVTISAATGFYFTTYIIYKFLRYISLKK